MLDKHAKPCNQNIISVVEELGYRFIPIAYDLHSEDPEEPTPVSGVFYQRSVDGNESILKGKQPAFTLSGDKIDCVDDECRTYFHSILSKISGADTRNISMIDW